MIGIFYGGNIYGAAASAKLINASSHAANQEQLEERGKKYDITRDFFEKILDNQPDNSLKRMVSLAIARTRIDEGNLEAARFELDELMKDNPHDREIYYWKGILSIILNYFTITLFLAINLTMMKKILLLMPWKRFLKKYPNTLCLT